MANNLEGTLKAKKKKWQKTGVTKDLIVEAFYKETANNNEVSEVNDPDVPETATKVKVLFQVDSALKKAHTLSLSFPPIELPNRFSNHLNLVHKVLNYHQRFK